MKRAQLQREIQIACHRQLTSWQPYRKIALYRRTEDFVQWLLFDIVEFKVAIRPYYALQALADHFPSIALTLGNVIRSPTGHGVWIEPENWRKQQEEIVKWLLQHVRPAPFKPLTTKSIMHFLSELDDTHPAVPTAKGIASFVLQDLMYGYAYLEQARKKYSQTSAPWAAVEAERINGWLEHSPETILTVLREDAREGAKLLGIKE